MTRTTRADRADELLHLSSDPRRRTLLRHLVSTDHDATTVAELAAVVAATEGGRDRGDVDEAAVSLKHCHLPKLDGAGFVDYDERSDVVRYDGHDDLEALLQFVADRLE